MNDAEGNAMWLQIVALSQGECMYIEYIHNLQSITVQMSLKVVSRISVPHVWHYNEWPLIQYIRTGEF